MPAIERFVVRPRRDQREAVIGGLFELCLSYTLERRTAELSSLVAPATYFALAPIIGSQAAARAARAPR